MPGPEPGSSWTSLGATPWRRSTIPSPTPADVGAHEVPDVPVNRWVGDGPASSVAAHARDADPHRNAAAQGEALGVQADPRDAGLVLRQVVAVAVGGRCIRVDDRASGEDHDVPALTITAEVERHARVGLDVADTGARHAVHDDR